MLIIMHHRDTKILKLLFDLKTPGSGNILKVDAAEYRGNSSDNSDQIIILCIKTYREGIYPCKLLKQDCLSLHHRNTCIRADIAKAKDCCSV